EEPQIRQAARCGEADRIRAERSVARHLEADLEPGVGRFWIGLERRLARKSRQKLSGIRKVRPGQRYLGNLPTLNPKRGRKGEGRGSGRRGGRRSLFLSPAEGRHTDAKRQRGDSKSDAAKPMSRHY